MKKYIMDKFITDLNTNQTIVVPPKFCECGCGIRIPYDRKYSHGHNMVGKSRGSSPLKGRPLSEEHKIKLSIAAKGRLISEETKRKMSEVKKGKISQMKGKHRTEEFKIKDRLGHIGKLHTDEHKRKISETLKGRISPMKGMKHSIETKELMSKKHKGVILGKEFGERISKALKGRPSPRKGKKAEEIYKDIEAYRRHMEIGKIKIREARAKQIIPYRDTKIEVKIQTFLKELNLSYVPHMMIYTKNFWHRCDAYVLGLNIVIECDGDYFHKYPTGTDRDHILTKEMTEAGVKVLRMWEKDINKMTVDNFKNILNEVK